MEFNVDFENQPTTFAQHTAHSNIVRDSDVHFKIDSTTRTVVNASQTKQMVVQYDHNSERFSFELSPRIIDGHDMGLSHIVQIHYLNIGKNGKTNKGVYEVDDLQLSDDGNAVVFSWLISENATRLAGSLHFLITFECLANNGAVDYRWSTNVHTGVTVAEGIDNGSYIVEQYPDILAEWDAHIDSIVQAKENGEFKGEKGDKGDTGNEGIYFGSDTPSGQYGVWIDPNSEPSNTEEWEFDMDDGTTETRTVVIV